LVVEYDRMMYPGVVIAVVGSDAEVSVLGYGWWCSEVLEVAC